MKNEPSLSLVDLRNLVMSEWDPIGVKGIPEAADEYDAYLSEMRQLVMSGASAQMLFEYLWKIETQRMGLTGDRENTLKFSGRLSELR